MADHPSYPSRVERDGMDTSRKPELLNPRPNHCEWKDSRTGMPTETPDYARDKE